MTENTSPAGVSGAAGVTTIMSKSTCKLGNPGITGGNPVGNTSSTSAAVLPWNVPPGDVKRAVASAKVMAGESAWKNARAAVQLHGGMGYTWEVPVHYYLKRTRVLENVFGTSEEHADALADGLGEAVA